MTAPTKQEVELQAATDRLGAALSSTIRNSDLSAPACVVALVDLAGGLVGRMRKEGNITDEHVRELSERFDLRINEARR